MGVSPPLQQPSPQSVPQSSAHVKASSPSASQQIPLPQFSDPQSSWQMQVSSLGLQQPSGHSSGQSAGQVQKFSEPLQQPSPQLEPQSAVQVQVSSSPPPQPSSQAVGPKSAGQVQEFSEAEQQATPW